MLMYGEAAPTKRSRKKRIKVTALFFLMRHSQNVHLIKKSNELKIGVKLEGLVIFFPSHYFLIKEKD